MTDPNVSAAERLPLPSLLSQALVAFTIEFDNEFEQQMRRSAKHPPWLVSLVMWSNCMQFVGEEGVPAGKLQDLARTKTNLNGMERWGYIIVEPDPDDNRPKPPRSDWIIRATPNGRKAQEVWRPLFGHIEERWRARFGKDEINRLRESLWTLISQIDVELPECLPILGYGMFSRGPEHTRGAPAGRQEKDGSRLALPALLARVLLAFAMEFERESDLSLAIAANLVRVLNEEGVRVRDLPLLTGVSKEAISMAMGVLQKSGVAVVGPDPTGGRAKVARLTAKGRKAQDTCSQLLGIIEERWRARFAEGTLRSLREQLERLAGEPTAQMSPLFRGLVPYPDGWRTSRRQPSTLPHYPMVLHRGGFPDGS